VTLSWKETVGTVLFALDTLGFLVGPLGSRGPGDPLARPCPGVGVVPRGAIGIAAVAKELVLVLPGSEWA
jgi:hypothetical protein